MPEVKKAMHYIFPGLVIIAWLAFEAFNYASTKAALTDIFGGAMLAVFLAIGLALGDVGAVATVFDDPETNEDDWIVYGLWGVWFFTALFNAMLTWYAVKLDMSLHEPVMATIAPVVMEYIPVLMAVSVLAIRVLIIRLVIGMFKNWAAGTGVIQKTPGYRPAQSQPRRTHIQR